MQAHYGESTHDDETSGQRPWRQGVAMVSVS